MSDPVNDYAVGQRDTRPWGDWEVLDVGDRYAVKRIRVAPGGRLSLQRHAHRREHWAIVAGAARVTIGNEVRALQTGETVDIDVGTIHRIENEGSIDAVLIEIQRGDTLRETDIERIEDVYGRGGA
jgi:mannose-1-phosphate guanylyltransferase/mannose-6-phosphate isomerase